MMTYLYMYRLTSDTGLAPCVDNGLLSLAVCKGGQIRNGRPCHTGLRYRIGSNKDGFDLKNDKVYVLGTYKSKFLYLARITEIKTMLEYFANMAKGRTDHIYNVKKGELVRNNNLRKQKVHLESEKHIRDLAGKFILLSDEFVYLGKDAVSVELVSIYGARFRETKFYKGQTADDIIEACLAYSDNKKHTPNNPFKTNCGCCK